MKDKDKIIEVLNQEIRVFPRKAGIIADRILAIQQEEAKEIKMKLVQDILSSLDEAFPEYHYEIVKDYLDDGC